MIKGVNRITMIIRTKEPYAVWANSFKDSGPSYDLHEHRQSPTTYLIDVPPREVVLKKLIKRYWQPIFDEELSGWMRDPNVWPASRTQEVFLEWFDVEISDLTLDLGRDYLIHD